MCSDRAPRSDEPTREPERRIRVLVGHCLDVLRTLDAGTVQTCVTSPPYFGLRDYGVAGQIGFESTPDGYVAKLVDVFREVRRVLRDDGTLWLNLGDSYAQSEVRHRNKESDTSGLATSRGEWSANVAQTGRKLSDNLKPKDLLGIPWRVAFALQADGWYLRSDIIWHKPNPMPESVTDRPTKAHEYLFLLAKAERYYYDADAIAEASVIGDGAIRRIGPDVPLRQDRNDAQRHVVNDGTRNRRTVWTVATQPYSGAHFATFPPKLIEPCVLAGSRKGDTVLDPFGGAGTTGLVADRLGRNALLIELNPAYAELARRRITDDAPLFGDVA